MIRAARIDVGEDLVDLTKGSGPSQVTIQYLRNSGVTPLYLGDIPLEPGESLTGITLGSVDHLHIKRCRAEDDKSDKDISGPVDVILGWA